MEKIGLVRTRDGKSFLVPFILITSLFFLWGVAHSILDVLNKHFQDTLEITRTRSALIQAVVYGGYFIMALPAGRIIRRFGYRTGVLTGLVLYGIGALLFIPGGPLLMGLIADRISMAVGFIVPLVCFMEIWGFAARYRKLS